MLKMQSGMVQYQTHKFMPKVIFADRFLVANLAAREDAEVLVPQRSAFDGQVQAWNRHGNACFMSYERA